ncbi:MAG: hypothetical protein HS113_11835 [Verrucomicrobiales bacterium]|nr:hypothetical protein [Verrucomicrobiales bacterium]
MELLKNHYEKVILGVVLLLLAVVAGYLPFEVANVRSRLDEGTSGIERGRVDPIPDLSLSTNEIVVARLNREIRFGFGTGVHGLFNPAGTWRKLPSGEVVPPPPAGIEGLLVTKISPLMLQIDYQGLSTGGGSQQRYRFYIKDESSTNRALERGRIVIQGPGARPEGFLIKEIIGPKEDPEQFRLELTDSRQVVTVTKEQGHSEVAGYAADLRHERETRSFPRQKKGSKITVGGTTYNIVAVSETDVTIEDDKTKRRTVVPLKSAP